MLLYGIKHQYYPNSITPDIKYWNIVQNAQLLPDQTIMEVNYDGIISTEVTGKGLGASSYCFVSLIYEYYLGDELNYNNNIYIILEGKYIYGSVKKAFKYEVAVTKYNAQDNMPFVAAGVEIETLRLPMEDLKVYVVNKSHGNGDSLYIYKCEIHRSMDNNNSQVNSQISSYLATSKLLEVDTRTENKLKVKYESGDITFDWDDDTTNHVITLTNEADGDQILLKY